MPEVDCCMILRDDVSIQERHTKPSGVLSLARNCLVQALLNIYSRCRSPAKSMVTHLGLHRSG